MKKRKCAGNVFLPCKTFVCWVASLPNMQLYSIALKGREGYEFTGARAC